jgi:hypothetical protein
MRYYPLVFLIVVLIASARSLVLVAIQAVMGRSIRVV